MVDNDGDNHNDKNYQIKQSDKISNFSKFDKSDLEPNLVAEHGLI